MWIVPIGIVFFILYYKTFTYIILHDDVETPGREHTIAFGKDMQDLEKDLKLSHKNYAYMAKKIIQNCGGHTNIITITNCITRLRLEVKDTSLLHDENIKRTGAKGVIRLSNTSAQIIIGTEVLQVREEIDRLMDEIRKREELV